MRKCDYCGREGTAPDVRGVKSVGINVGNYRMTMDVDLSICEMCANVVMGVAMGGIANQLQERNSK